MSDQATSVTRKYWTLPVQHAEIRLDAFIRQCLPHLSRREVENAIRDRLFSVGEKVSKKGDRLAGGDRLVFQVLQIGSRSTRRPLNDLDVRIVYEDLSILIVDKPAGLPTHGFSGRDGATLANFLVARRPELANIGKSRWEPGMVHRLDADTSGLVVVAKTQIAFENLRLNFAEGESRKFTWRWFGESLHAEGVIEIPLVHDRRDKRRMRAMPRSRRKRNELGMRSHVIGASVNLAV